MAGGSPPSTGSDIGVDRDAKPWTSTLDGTGIVARPSRRTPASRNRDAVRRPGHLRDLPGAVQRGERRRCSRCRPRAAPRPETGASWRTGPRCPRAGGIRPALGGGEPAVRCMAIRPPKLGSHSAARRRRRIGRMSTDVGGAGVPVGAEARRPRGVRPAETRRGVAFRPTIGLGRRGELSSASSLAGTAITLAWCMRSGVPSPGNFIRAVTSCQVSRSRELIAR